MWLSLMLLLSMWLTSVKGASERIGCQPTEFRCGSGQCVDSGRYCDGNHDCYDGTDEPERCTNCNRTFYGMLDVKYPLRLSERRSPTCTLSFIAAGGKYGDRVEITFLSFHVGMFDFDSSSCLRGYMEVEDSRPVNPRKRSTKGRRRAKKKGVPRRKGDPLKSVSGSFCGALIGQSATFYSTGDQVKLTVFVPPQGAAGQPVAPRLYLTYRFLELSNEADHSSLYGTVATGSKCDAVLTNCHFRQCVIRSPNYPGFYLRNISCFYYVRQDSTPPGKIAQIEVYQINEFKINIPSGHTNNDRYKPGTLTSDCAGDTIKIYDGRTIESPLLAEFCGAGPLPVIRSSGPDLLVQLVSVPSQPLANSHFELDVRIHFARNSASNRGVSEGCSLNVDGGRHPVGILRAPEHSLPSGTNCTYRVTGKKPTDRVWLYFSSYHIPDLHPWTDFEHCDVGMLEIKLSQPKVRHSHHYYHTNPYHSPKDLESVQEDQSLIVTETFCEKKSPKQCGHASDFLDLIPSRPCSKTKESYLSEGPELELKMSFLAPLAIRGNEPYFTARYEVVDTVNTKHGINSYPCFVVINSNDSPTGTLESPRNVFLYGRGGSKDLNCKYILEGSVNQKVLITVEDIHFSTATLCETVYESVVQRHNCNIFKFSKFAAINVTEMWQDFKVFVGCVCDSSNRFTLESVGHNVQVEFLVRDMGPRDDFKTFSFRLLYEFVPASTVCRDNRSLQRVMSDSKGHLTLHFHSALPFRCRWLLAALPSRALYVTVRGTTLNAECKNKILFYTAYNREPYAVYCASNEEIHETFFTESWKPGSQNIFDPDLTIVEFIISEPGRMQISWIEVIRPGMNLCPIECPELEACIGEDLACDGVHHCPVTANDESPERCVTFPFTMVAIFSSAAIALLTMIILLLIVRHRLRNSPSKSVIPPPEMYRSDCKHSTLSKPPVR